MSAGTIYSFFEICQTLNFEQMIHGVSGSWKLAPYMYQYVDYSIC